MVLPRSGITNLFTVSKEEILKGTHKKKKKKGYWKKVEVSINALRTKGELQDLIGITRDPESVLSLVHR